MQLDDERESDYVEDRRSDDGGGFGGGYGDDPFGGRPYGGGGGFGGGYGGGPFGGFFGGILGGILGGMLSRRNDPYGQPPPPPYGNDPYYGQPYPERRGMGLFGKIVIALLIVLAVLFISYYLNFGSRPSYAPAPTQRPQTMPPMQQPGQQARPVDPARDSQAKMVSEMKKVLAKTEDTWEALFKEMGSQYKRPYLVLFTNATQTACGKGQTATGPFYCPADQRVYLDLRFFNEMERRFHAGGDFARAYVIAHEVGHHVQNLTGTMQRVNELRQRMSQTEFNKVSVRLELQADCYAGVWAYHANKKKPFLDPGDVEEALKAAKAVGDDTIQRSTRGTVMPDSFTHGTSEQRMRWFKTGFDGGSLKTCDTFNQPI